MFFCVIHKKTIQKGLVAALALTVAGGLAHRTFEQKTVKASAEAELPKAYVAIVIDDFGYSGEGTEEMLALSIPITAAIMPFSPESVQDADAVEKAGKEAIIHLPMESLTGKKSWVGDKGIFKSMTDAEIRERVNEALVVVPNAVGLNNHMGSAIMEDARCLKAVLDVVKDNHLIFLDSMTTAKSQTESLCQENQIPLLKRDVFLDSTDDINVVKKNLEKITKIALKKGTGVCIGHVGPEGGKITAQAIKELAPQMEQQGIKFVTLSQLSRIIEEKKLSEQ